MSIRLRRLLLFITVSLFSLYGGQTARAGLIQLGGTYTTQGTNFIDNYSQTVTVSPLPQLVDGGKLLLTLTTFPTGANSEWDDFGFQSVSGGPLAGDIHAFWQQVFLGIPMSKSAVWDGIYLYWTKDGKAFDPIFPFGGGAFGMVGPNPVNPALGPVFIAPIDSFPPVGPATSFDFTPFAFISPYSFVSSGGVDPNTANGIHFAIHFEAATATVPEPSTIALLATGGLGLLGWIWRRRKRVTT